MLASMTDRGTAGPAGEKSLQSASFSAGLGTLTLTHHALVDLLKNLSTSIFLLHNIHKSADNSHQK